MGKETSKQVLLEKPNLIVLACRTQAKAEAVKKELESEAGNTKLIALGGFDMNNPEGIREAISKLDSSIELDIVFLQSGGVFVRNHAVIAASAASNTAPGQRPMSIRT